ncbi:MAG TPA: apolipoprotein N-acyltransferase [Kaistiaceae bacterium]|nr:apolipoprotein N-acyltransferase [Kaistiaceae bacterium]
MIRQIANRVILSWGWQRAAIAMAAGAVSVLALAPFDILPILWISLPVLVWLLDGAVAAPGIRGPRALFPAFATGWWFGFGYFLAGLWWVGSAFLVEAEDFGWMLPFAVMLLPAGLAIFVGLATAAARMAWFDGWRRVVALVIALALADWLRGHVLTGFPWNLFGQALAATDAGMQTAAFLGAYAMTPLVVLIFAAPATLADDRGRLALPVIGLVLLGLLHGAGLYRLGHADPGTVPGVALRIVQPAIDQREKWKPGNEEKVFETYLELSDARTSPEHVGVLTATHLIWPESAFPFLLTESPGALAAIADLLPPGTILLSGAIRAEPATADHGRRFFNSVYAIDPDGEIIDAYDKVRLVPFGEFLPLQPLLESIGLEQLTRIHGGFEAGTRRRPIELMNTPPLLPLICYEIIFPEALNDGATAPGWVLNVTNDAWFGDSPGPYQHLRQARIRAAEQGLPVVRAANTGVSAVIDGYGRILQQAPLGQPMVIDAELPKALSRPVGATYGAEIFWLLIGGLAAVLGAASRLTLHD